MSLSGRDDGAIFALGLDNRLDFCRELVGSGEKPTAAERHEAAALKSIVFDALAASIEAGIPKSGVLLWSDHDLGEGVLLRGRAMSLRVVVALERQGVNGASELSPAGAVAAWSAITKLNAAYASVRLAYNFGDVPPHKQALLEQLRLVLNKCQELDKRLIIELAPHPTREQIDESGGTATAALHTKLLVEGIRELQDGGIEPSIWTVSPPGDLLSAATVAAQAHVDGRANVKVLFQVAADPDQSHATATISRLDRALAKLSARTLGVSGIIAGPDAFFGVLVKYRQKAIAREDAVQAIAGRLRKLWDVYSEASKTSSVT